MGNIKDNRLYLINLKAYIEDYKEVGLNYLFPGQERIFADRFNGEIRVPQEKMRQYVHMGYETLYESDLILILENGVVVNPYETVNIENI